MIKTILKINLLILLLALQGCAYEYCCVDVVGEYLDDINDNGTPDNQIYKSGDCYRFRASCEVMCGGDCYGGPTDQHIGLMIDKIYFKNNSIYSTPSFTGLHI